MNFLETAPGQQRGWNLLSKLGEGDAGEVYQVELLIDRRLAILKRPRRKSFPSDLIRQASQIQKEAEILGILSSINTPAHTIRSPYLIDRSKPGTEFTDRFFIIISPASGISLDQMARQIRFSDNSSQDNKSEGQHSSIEKQSLFVKEISRQGRIPELLLLRAIVGIIEYLETIHTITAELPSGAIFGILWNDIKTEHIFWDYQNLQFTIIDWGNGQFVEADGISKDRIHSRLGDYQQFLSEMGQFLARESAPLFEMLDWPTVFLATNAFSAGVSPILKKAKNLLNDLMVDRRILRRSEKDMIDMNSASMDDFTELSEIHNRIFALGELPDCEGAKIIFQKIAHSLVESGDFELFSNLCDQAQEKQIIRNEYADILLGISKLVKTGEIGIDTLTAGIDENWISSFWSLRIASLRNPVPDWWEIFSEQIRSYEIGPTSLRPVIATNRLVHALLSTEKLEHDNRLRLEIINTLREIILPRWTLLEPDPPDSGINYLDIQQVLQKAALLLPDATKSVFNALDQAQAQAQIALDAWNRKDFHSAHVALQRVLIWDPDRIRLIQADKALKEADTWINEIRTGLTNEEPLQDFITRHELRGREIRNQIGAAVWLDDILEAFSKVRKGVEPTDVLIQHENLRTDLSWLISLEPRRPLMAMSRGIVQIERKEFQRTIQPAITGIKELRIGTSAGILLGEPLDSWAPEARGSSARIFRGNVPAQSGQRISTAFKIMRPDRTEYALPLFREEALILSLMHDVTGVIPLLECGFILRDSTEFPSETTSQSADMLKGMFFVSEWIQSIIFWRISKTGQLAVGFLTWQFKNILSKTTCCSNAIQDTPMVNSSRL